MIHLYAAYARYKFMTSSFVAKFAENALALPEATPSRNACL